MVRSPGSFRLRSPAVSKSRHCEERLRRSNPYLLCRAMDCFASLAMTRKLSRIALRQIVVGIKRLRIVLGLGFEATIFDQQIDGISHVLVGDLERPLALGFRCT